jgi:hypothetical protein
MRAQIMICCPQYHVTVKLLSHRPVTNLPLYVLPIVLAKFRNHTKGQKHKLNETNRISQHVQFL